MKLKSQYWYISVIILLTACGSDGGGNSGSSAGNTNTQIKFADYFPLALPPQTSSCTSTTEITLGANLGQTGTSIVDGSMETINYTSGALEGSVITNNDNGVIETLVIQNDGTNIKYLRYGDEIASSDCNLSSHPSAYSFGIITDGMIKDIINFSAINRNNMSVCTISPSATESGNRALYKIVDVTVQGKTYNDSIVEYWLDIDIPFASLQYSGNFGIPIPTTTETEGGSVTDVSIFAFGEGEIAYISVGANDGQVLAAPDNSKRHFFCEKNRKNVPL